MKTRTRLCLLMVAWLAIALLASTCRGGDQQTKLVMDRLAKIEADQASMLGMIVSIQATLERIAPTVQKAEATMLADDASGFPSYQAKQTRLPSGVTKVEDTSGSPNPQPTVFKWSRETFADKSPLPLDAVPEWEISTKIGGRHLIDPESNIPVYALSEWRVVKRGQCEFREPVRLYGRPVPVGAVFYNSSTAKEAPPPATNYNFGPQQ